MAHWLVKTEPGEYSYDDLERAGRGVWDGVRNPQALKSLRAMKPGDGVVVYHSGVDRAAAGTAAVVGEPYPDPASGDARLWVVDVIPRKRLGRPVPLAELKADPLFAGSALVRQGRLSVVPLSEEQWRRIVELSDRACPSGGRGAR